MLRISRKLLMLLLLGSVFVAIFAGTPVPRDGSPEAIGRGSPMQNAWMDHLEVPFDPILGEHPVIVRPLSATSSPVTVLGFLPYWNFGSATIRLDRITVLSYFGAAISAKGKISDFHHWYEPEMAELIDAAHAAGVKVVLTVINFSEDDIRALLGSASAMNTAVGELAGIVSDIGADGVNIDFEGVPVDVKQGLVDFMANLKAAMSAVAPDGGHVTVDTPAVDWLGAFDYDELANVCDGLVIMGYDYHYRGGAPGPVSPLEGSTLWGKYALDWTLDDYDDYGGVENRDRFILALPLYGYDWPVASNVIPAKSAGTAEAVFYSECVAQGEEHGWQWDEDASTPYYAYKSDDWHQVWCESATSMTAKFRLTAERGLGGVGFWALGYEGADSEVWDVLADVLIPETGDLEPPVTVDTGAGTLVSPATFRDVPWTWSFPEAPDAPDAPEASEHSSELSTMEVIEDNAESGDVGVGLPDTHGSHDVGSMTDGCSADNATSTDPFSVVALFFGLGALFLYARVGRRSH